MIENRTKKVSYQAEKREYEWQDSKKTSPSLFVPFGIGKGIEGMGPIFICTCFSNYYIIIELMTEPNRRHHE